VGVVGAVGSHLAVPSVLSGVLGGAWLSASSSINTPTVRRRLPCRGLCGGLSAHSIAPPELIPIGAPIAVTSRATSTLTVTTSIPPLLHTTVALGVGLRWVLPVSLSMPAILRKRRSLLRLSGCDAQPRRGESRGCPENCHDSQLHTSDKKEEK
jgi:hypothetical protein